MRLVIFGTTPFITRRFMRLRISLCFAEELPVNVILGVPTHDASQSRQDYFRRTVENLQSAYEIARSNLQERTETQARSNADMTFPSFQSGATPTIHRSRWPQPQVDQSLEGPLVVRSRCFPSFTVFLRANNPKKRPSIWPASSLILLRPLDPHLSLIHWMISSLALKFLFRILITSRPKYELEI